VLLQKVISSRRRPFKSLHIWEQTTLEVAMVETDLRGNATFFIEREGRIVDSETVDNWKKDRLLQKIKEYNL
jgi:hypothetical protein